MTIQDFGLGHRLAHALALVSYDVDLEARTSSCCRWQVNGILCSHVLMVLRDREVQSEEYVDKYFHSDYFTLT